MKILELRFKNLNSLYGEWVIDFTNPEYVVNGIFALIGATGAGKSTILDAICLALYGATPRLGKITKSGNEIMSRQTGECYAEVLFESQAGRFRCHWEQRRARKKADANLQDQEHQIADADTGKLIEVKKSLVSGVIEEKTGMDFERFTRSILLAQGGFDTFLKADVEQKSKILEQVTGTEIYSEISRRVHERVRNESEKFSLLQAETSGIVILEPELEANIQQELEAKQKQEKELADKSIETAKAIAWLVTIEALKLETSGLVEEKAQLQSNIESFKPEGNKLDWAIKASSLAGTHATLTAIKKQQLDDQTSSKAQEKALPELEANANSQAEAFKLVAQQMVKAKDELKDAVLLIQEVRLLDQKLAEQGKAVLEGNESRKRSVAKIDADKQAQAKEQEKRREAEQTLELVCSYLKEHAPDEWLISGLAGVEEQLGNLCSSQKEINQKALEYKKAKLAMEQAVTKFERCEKQCGINKQEHEEATKNIKKGKVLLSELLGVRLLREYRTEKETLLHEMVYLSKIKELEGYRVKLEDDKPCPLCGAKEHPFAEGNVPLADEIEQKVESLTDLIKKAETLESANKNLEEAKAAAYKKLNDSEMLKTSAQGDKNLAYESLSKINDSLEKLQLSFDELKQTIANSLQLLGITEILEEEVQSLLNSLKSRLNSWQSQVNKKAVIEKQIADINSEIKRLDAIIETQNYALTEKQEILEQLKKERVIVSDRRSKLYGDKNPDDEEARLNKAVVDIEKDEKKARNLNIELQQKLMTVKTQVESLKKRIELRVLELKKTEDDFLTTLGAVGFLDEKQFLEARLTNEQQNALSARAKELDAAQIDIKAREKDREIRLEGEIAKNITDKTLAELEPQLKEYEEFLKELRESATALKHKLGEDIAAKERIKEKQGAIGIQKKECHRWVKLHGLIGAADGKKYRNFAQGLTFELMVAHANQQLAKMTERYLLIRDKQQPLELNVVDSYQAGEIRSAKNLSGGESFIVSLALALGLAKMASRKVRVDSLFLDEGFGTLDEEALEAALETLSGLQEDGKLIGVISHVPALKERISTQITITPVSGGHSSLSGPGCKKL